MFSRHRRYRPDPDSYFLVRAQSGTFRFYGSATMSAFEEMCDRTHREHSVLLGVEERRRGDDPEVDPPVRRIGRQELAVICAEAGYWP